MKVIGKSADGFILVAPRDEVARLIGYYYCSGDVEAQLSIGAEIQVSAMYSQLYLFQKHRKELDEAAGTLAKIAENVRALAPVVAAPDPGSSTERR